MTDPPIDITQAREQDAPGTHDAKRQAPVHGHTGDVPSDKALSDRSAEGQQCSVQARASTGLSHGRNFCTCVELSSVLSTRTRLAPLSAVEVESSSSSPPRWAPAGAGEEPLCPSTRSRSFFLDAGA
eukprot:scaffold16555_cov130-Isochrysis_galbana.AAC.4